MCSMNKAMLLEGARGVLFTRAIARVFTSHAEVRGGSRTEFVRLMGEFVSLLVLIYLAERAASHHPWTPLLGAVFAFLLPTIVLRDAVIAEACGTLGVEVSVRNHVLVGLVGVLLCYVVYEALLHLMEFAYKA